MNRKEIEKKKSELTEILKENNMAGRLERLQGLAMEVGASVIRMEGIPSARNVITESEIVHNIQVALQTETAIDMSKTAARNFLIAVISAATALLAMLAAWAAVAVKIKCG